ETARREPFPRLGLNVRSVDEVGRSLDEGIGIRRQKETGMRLAPGEPGNESDEGKEREAEDRFPRTALPDQQNEQSGGAEKREALRRDRASKQEPGEPRPARLLGARHQLEGGRGEAKGREEVDVGLFQLNEPGREGRDRQEDERGFSAPPEAARE